MVLACAAAEAAWVPFAHLVLERADPIAEIRDRGDRLRGGAGRLGSRSRAVRRFLGPGIGLVGEGLRRLDPLIDRALRSFERAETRLEPLQRVRARHARQALLDLSDARIVLRRIGTPDIVGEHQAGPDEAAEQACGGKRSVRGRSPRGLLASGLGKFLLGGFVLGKRLGSGGAHIAIGDRRIGRDLVRARRHRFRNRFATRRGSRPDSSRGISAPGSWLAPVVAEAAAGSRAPSSTTFALRSMVGGSATGPGGGAGVRWDRMNRSRGHSVSSEYGKLEQGVSFLTLGSRAMRPRRLPEGVEGREQRGFVRLGRDQNGRVQGCERDRNVR